MKQRPNLVNIHPQHSLTVASQALFSHRSSQSFTACFNILPHTLLCSQKLGRLTTLVCRHACEATPKRGGVETWWKVSSFGSTTWHVQHTPTTLFECCFTGMSENKSVQQSPSFDCRLTAGVGLSTSLCPSWRITCTPTDQEQSPLHSMFQSFPTKFTAMWKEECKHHMQNCYDDPNQYLYL